MSFLKRILVANPLLLLAVAGIAYLAIANARLRHEQGARDRAAEAALTARARELDAVKGERVREGELLRGLSVELRTMAAEMKKIDRRATPASVSTTTVRIEDTIPGEVITPPSGPAEWRDGYNRFRLFLPNGPLERRQSFRLEGIVIRGPRGSRFQQVAFQELDPVTGERVPLDGTIKIEHDFRFTEEADTRVFHPRVVAAFDHRASIGAGVQFLDWRSLNLSALGYYNRADRDVRAVLQLGYRIRFPFFDSTLSVGPYYGLSSSGAQVAGAGITLELTR